MEDSSDSIEASANVATTTNDAEPNKRIRNRLKKILKEDSTLSILKISATALTAVSMALISTRLTSIFNSLVLVAIISALSAIVSEFYRVILSVTTLGAQKVIATRFQVNSDGTTIEVPVTVPETASIADANSVTGPMEPNNTGRVKQYFRDNPLMKMVAIFTIISAATIAASYFITASSSKSPAVNNYTTIQKPIESLTDLEKQKIIDAAVGTSLSDTAAQKETLQSQIDSLEQVNSDLEKSLASLQKEKSITDDALAKMDAKLKAIEQKLDNAPAAPTPSPTPNPINILPKPTVTATPTATAPPAQ